MPDKLGPLALSKREHFAALIMAGMNASPDQLNSSYQMAADAIEQADELISQLYALRVAENYNAHAPSDPEDVAMDELRNELYSAEILLGGGE